MKYPYKDISTRYISKESISGLLLFLCALLAMIIANSQYSEFYHNFWHINLGLKADEFFISMDLTHWIDDGLMSLFFLMVGLEIKRELIAGELTGWKKASFPIFGAIGGMLVPSIFYILINPNQPEGFGIPMATDIAFALGILMIFGKYIPTSLKIFLVSLAVVDDLGAILIIAFFYTDDLNLNYLLASFTIFIILILMNIFKIKRLSPYMIIGIFLWVAIYKTGIHATIAGVLIAIAVPIRSALSEKNFVAITHHNINIFANSGNLQSILTSKQMNSLEAIVEAYDRVQNPLVRLQKNLHNLSAYFIMPLFAFSNGGVTITTDNIEGSLSLIFAIIFGLVLGKPIGIFVFCYIGQKLKLLSIPDELKKSHILAGGFFGGIGFTMSIFISQLAFTQQNHIDASKIAIICASLIASIIGIVIILSIKKSKNQIE